MRTPFELGIIGEIMGCIAKPDENLEGPMFFHPTGALKHFFLADGFSVSFLLTQEVNIIIGAEAQLFQVSL